MKLFQNTSCARCWIRLILGQEFSFQFSSILAQSQLTETRPRHSSGTCWGVTQRKLAVWGTQVWALPKGLWL